MRSLPAGLALCALAGLAASSACRKSPAEGARADASAQDGGPADLQPSVMPARCRTAARPLGMPPSDDVQIGDAQSFPGGVAVGLVHHTSAGVVSAVAIAPTGAGAVKVMDLGRTLGDAPPPRLAWRGKDLLVADYVLSSKAPRADAPRELAVWAIAPSSWSDPQEQAPKAPEPLASVPRQRGDSLAFDLAHENGRALLVWDETAPAGTTPRGVIRASTLADDRMSPVHDVSPPESDAEAPRVVPSGDGFFVLWIARRPEHDRAGGEGGAESIGEVTGEPRAFSWLEMVRVDAQGAAAGGVRRLTSSTGHVSAYDVALLDGAPRPTVLAVARDDGEAVDGSGGALLRVRAGADFADVPLELPTDGLGRGAPTLIDGSPPWLTWVDQHEQLRLLPLDAAGAPLGRSSAEESLGEARPLVWLDRNEMLVARAARGGGSGDASDYGARAELAVVTCGR